MTYLNKEKQLAYQRAWRRSHPQYYKKWTEAHPTYKRDYWDKNKARISKKFKEWVKANPDRMKALRIAYADKHPWFNHFRNAKARCENPENKSYRWYGGQGIKFNLTLSDIKNLWQASMAMDMKRPTLLRTDHNTHYTKENCTFIDRAKMKTSLNHRRKTPPKSISLSVLTSTK